MSEYPIEILKMDPIFSEICMFRIQPVNKLQYVQETSFCVHMQPGIVEVPTFE